MLAMNFLVGTYMPSWRYWVSMTPVFLTLIAISAVLDFIVMIIRSHGHEKKMQEVNRVEITPESIRTFKFSHTSSHPGRLRFYTEGYNREEVTLFLNRIADVLGKAISDLKAVMPDYEELRPEELDGLDDEDVEWVKSILVERLKDKTFTRVPFRTIHYVTDEFDGYDKEEVDVYLWRLANKLEEVLSMLREA